MHAGASAPPSTRGSHDLSLDAPWCLGERAFSVVCDDLASRSPRVLAELGSGVSTARFALAFPELRLVSFDSDATYLERTRERLRACGAESRVTLVHAPLAWQWHGRAPYLGFAIGERPRALAEGCDAILVDGPPHFTGRGREAALHALVSALRVGGRVYLDDHRRRGERRTVANWLSAYPGSLRLVRVVDVDSGLAILEKIAHVEPPAVTPSRVLDAYVTALAQPFASRAREVSLATQRSLRTWQESRFVRRRR